LARHRVAILTSLILLPGAACVSPQAHHELQAANDDLQRQLADLERYHQELEGENGRLRAEVELLGQDVAEADFVRGQKVELAELIKEFQTGGAQEIEGIKVIRTSEGVAFQVQGEVLFSSGQATITSSGKEALGRLLPTLREHTKNLRIDGHTDIDPIRRSQWKTNMRLSAERGMAVIDFLTGNGIDPATCFLAAYGEHRPAVTGSDDAAKRQNRRVEILMLR
jgi:chemotaxis protein MotB